MAEPPSDDKTVQPPDFTEFNDLASSKVGGKVIFATDDWFACAENLLLTDAPTFQPTAFTDFGKLMDGWETRRKRIPGHDWCVIQLGAPGVIHGLDVDTSFFTGNYTPKVSIQAATLGTDLPARSGDRMGTAETAPEREAADKLQSENWTEILTTSALRPGYKTTCHNYFNVNSSNAWTHLRINMYPDGGIARLHVYGQVVRDWAKVPGDELVDLAAMMSGGVCIGYSNVHFGHARNLISPGRSITMADGWETARRLDRPEILKLDENGLMDVPGSEWAVFKLGHPGIISKIEADTNHFKGNFPDRCWVEACYVRDSSRKIPQSGWKILLPAQKLTAHKRHYYEGSQIQDCGVVSHIRIFMAPDGGISRMRFWGHKTNLTSNV